MNCPVCRSDDTKFWWIASVAVCFKCDTYWRPRGRAVVRSTSELDWSDDGALDDFVTELLASVTPRSARKAEPEIDILVRFVGEGDRTSPSDFHSRILGSLVQELPDLVSFWAGGGTPAEFSARVPVAGDSPPSELVEAVRSALAPWPTWEVITFADRPRPDTRR